MANDLHIVTPQRIADLLAIREAKPGTDAEAQRQRLLIAIQRLQHVSTFEASRYLDVYYPPARKMELVREGHPIGKVMRSVLTEAGKRHSVGVYFMTKG